MKYDLIMVAASKSSRLIRMTQEAIDSCLADGADVNVILVETFKKTHYRGVNKTVIYNEDFNYNRCLNAGLKFRKGDIQILANNDIIFYKGWSDIGEIMQKNEILSASALSNHPLHRQFKQGYHAYPGYDICLYFTGWCLFAHKSIFDKIGSLDETYTFWYSDDQYAAQLRQAKIPHFLICAVRVDHYISKTLSTVELKKRREYTDATRKGVHKRNRKNLQA